MNHKPSRSISEEAAATPGEIAEAINALTTGELAKLRDFAIFRIRILGRKANGRTFEDLIQTAMLALLSGNRRWDKSKVEFLPLLKGAVKSISSSWAKSFKGAKAAMLETELLQVDKQGKTFSPLDNEADHNPTPEEQHIDKETLEHIESLFNDDEEAQMVLTSWQEGYNPAETRELWSLSQKEYNTIVRRIRRRITAADITPERN